MLTPETEDHLAEIIRGANGPLSLRGGATRHLPEDGEALTTAGMTGITLYEPGALTLVAKAGTPMAEIEAALADAGQRMPFEPMDHRALLGTGGVPTIGGAVALNASGPRRVQAGACRDSLIGVRFVDGTGTVVKNGGRVMKNVTGYDLVKLMAGSRGRLGVMTEVAFKVLPAAETAAAVLIDGLDVPGAVRAMSDALRSPYEVSAAAHGPLGADGAPVTVLRLEGLAASVAYRAEKLTALLSEHGPVRVESGEGGADALAALWTRVRDAEPFAGTGEDVWRIHCRPSHAPGICARLETERLLLDWGGGLIWAGVPAGTDLRARLGDVAGHATRVRGRGPGAMPKPPEPVAALEGAIREKFDPKGLFRGTA